MHGALAAGLTGRPKLWKFTASPSSRTSEDREPGRRGQISWQRDTAKPF